GQRRGVARQPFAQSLTLRDVEDDEALQERHGPRLAALARGSLLFGFGSEAVCIDHGHPALALADTAARFARLPEGQPALRWPALRDHRAPQDQDIDPGIGPMGQRIARQAGTNRSRSSPWLDPRDAAFLEFGDDPRGDLVIEVRANLAG